MPWPMWMRRALILLLSLTLCWGTAQMAAAHVDMALQSPMVICANGAEVAVTLAPDGRAVPVTLGHHRCPDCLPATLALPPGDGGLRRTRLPRAARCGGLCLWPCGCLARPWVCRLPVRPRF